jgi:hypothetical protein
MFSSSAHSSPRQQIASSSNLLDQFPVAKFTHSSKKKCCNAEPLCIRCVFVTGRLFR